VEEVEMGVAEWEPSLVGKGVGMEEGEVEEARMGV